MRTHVRHNVDWVGITDGQWCYFLMRLCYFENDSARSTRGDTLSTLRRKETSKKSDESLSNMSNMCLLSTNVLLLYTRNKTNRVHHDLERVPAVYSPREHHQHHRRRSPFWVLRAFLADSFLILSASSASLFCRAVDWWAFFWASRWTSKIGRIRMGIKTVDLLCLVRHTKNISKGRVSAGIDSWGRLVLRYGYFVRSSPGVPPLHTAGVCWYLGSDLLFHVLLVEVLA